MMAAGFGFRASATVDSLRQALAATQHHPTLLATVDEKAAATPLLALAAELDLPVVSVARPHLTNVATLTVSAPSLAAFGTGSVAEAAALAALGAGSRLVGPRVISHDGQATCAIATKDTE